MLPAKTILAIISLICAVLFFANIVRRTWLLPGIGVGLLLLSALLIGGIYPAIVQRFQVTADASRTRRRRTSSATSTRRATAYGIDTVKVQTYARTTRRPRPTQLRGGRRHDGQHPAARPADRSARRSSNLQQVKAYYDFPDALDVDRYDVDGAERATPSSRCASST